jgi:glycerophosphoryl diester phosphodiesterase
MLNKPFVIAHRGESNDAPENTMAAINLAWQRKCKAVEIDIHLTTDNKVVAIHDADTERVGNYKYIIAETEFEKLKKCDVGSWKGKNFANERIPLFVDILKTIPEQGRLVTEIKCGIEVLPYVVELVKNSGCKPEQIEFIAGREEVLLN